MAAIIPRKQAHCHIKRSIINGSVEPGDNHQSGLIRHSGKHSLFQDSENFADIDDRLRALENSAWQQFVAVYKRLSLERPPGWFEKILDESFLPTLHRIGFDGPVSRVVFEMALPSWKRIGPLNEKIIAFNPRIEHEIDEVCQGLKAKACNGSDRLIPSGDTTQTTITGTINNDAAPENLFALLDDICTAWIILPRVSRFLEIHHCHYLPAYLKTIDRESIELCLRQFGRITVEFVGNYSLKFADEHHPKQNLTQLLFFGYAALFWKNLRHPPEMLENSGIFISFFNWIKRLARENEFLGAEANETIKHMIKLKTLLFPTGNFNGRPKREQPRFSHFLITLRHGEMGVAMALKYFGIDHFLNTRHGRDRFMSPSIQNETLCLLRTIQTHYKSESKRTQMYIRQFTGHLKSAYMLMQPSFQRTQTQFWNQIFSNMDTLFNT
jgi:hypothetical protein